MQNLTWKAHKTGLWRQRHLRNMRAWTFQSAPCRSHLFQPRNSFSNSSRYGSSVHESDGLQDAQYARRSASLNYLRINLLRLLAFSTEVATRANGFRILGCGSVWTTSSLERRWVRAYQLDWMNLLDQLIPFLHFFINVQKGSSCESKHFALSTSHCSHVRFPFLSWKTRCNSWRLLWAADWSMGGGHAEKPIGVLAHLFAFCKCTATASLD